VFLALAEAGAKSALTEALNANIEAAKRCSCFQARTIRQAQLRNLAQQAELTRIEANSAATTTQPERSPGAAAHRESESETGEGRRESMGR